MEDEELGAQRDYNKDITLHSVRRDFYYYYSGYKMRKYEIPHSNRSNCIIFKLAKQKFLFQN